MSDSLTLYGVHEELQAFMDSFDLAETDEQRAEIAIRIRELVDAEVRKVDGIAAYIRRCEAESEFCASEAKRIAARAKNWDARVSRLKTYIQDFMEKLPTDAKGRQVKRLEGRESAFTLAKNPDTVLITDESAVPAQYKTWSISVPGSTWTEFALCFADHPAFKRFIAAVKADVSIDRRAIGKALKSGEEIDGADVGFGTNRVDVK